MKSYKLHKNKQGFTLIEIIVVLVIIGIVMMLAVPAVMKYSNEAAETKAKSQARAAYLAAQTITLDMIKDNPGVSPQVIMEKINNAEVINKELGIEKNRRETAKRSRSCKWNILFSQGKGQAHRRLYYRSAGLS